MKHSQTRYDYRKGCMNIIPLIYVRDNYDRVDTLLDSTGLWGILQEAEPLLIMYTSHI